MTPFELCTEVEKLLSPLHPSPEILAEMSDFVLRVQRQQELDAMRDMANLAKNMSHTTSMNVAAAIDFVHSKRKEAHEHPEKSAESYVYRYFHLV